MAAINIPFNRSPFVESYLDYIPQVFQNNKLSGDGEFTQKCSEWMQRRFGAKRVLLTTSGSHALDMTAHLAGLRRGDEVIMASYTFSSTANAYVGVGATIVFVDIRPDTMNIDETRIEDAITKKTKAIVPMHYAGVACDMDAINAMAQKHGLLVIEDAAQGVMSAYKDKALGNLADMGCYSFHETKNYSMGEGGALLLNDDALIERAELLREKGTDRSRFFRGQVDKYSWVDWGSSYLPSELNAAYLWAQLERADAINDDRLRSWRQYNEALAPLAARDLIKLPHIPGDCVHNAHMYYIKTKDLETRTALISYLKERGILAVYHYVPLHSAKAGLKHGRFHGQNRYTTRESERLVRLPMYYQLSPGDIEQVCAAIHAFYGV